MKQEETRADRVIKFIQTYIFTPEGAHVGKPMILENFQKDFIKDVYSNPHGTRRAYLSLARKNGKSALISALLLAHIIGPERVQNSQIVSGARSRDQAALVYDLAAKMLNMQPKFQGLYRLVPSGKRIIGLKSNVEYKALSAEAKTAHGLSPIVAILDEVGQVRGPKDDFIDAITTAQGAHTKPILMAISTQAADDADLFSIWIDDALASHDPKIVCHLYAAKPTAGLLDQEGWRAANPALGIFRSLEDLEEQAKQAVRMPSSENTFRNLMLNQRVSTTSPFASLNIWKSCGDEIEKYNGELVYGGLDLSSRADLTSLELIYKTNGKWNVISHFWTPEKGLMDRARRDRTPYDVWEKQGFLYTTPGATVDYEYVAKHIKLLLDHMNVASIAYDRWRIDLLKKEFNDIGLELPLSECGQGYKDMSPAIDALESELLNARIRHGMHPVLTMCAANAIVIKDPSGNRKLDKSKSTGRIDGMVALAMAFHAIGSDSEIEGDLDGFLNNPLSLRH